MNIGNMKVSTRLASGFGIVFVLMIVLAALAIGRVNSIDAILATINDVNGAKQRQAINFRGSVHDRAIAVRDAVLATDKASVQAEIDRITVLADKYAKSDVVLAQILSINSQTVSAEEKQALADIKAVEAKTQPMIAKLIELRLNENTPEAIELLRRQAAPAFVEWLASINRLIDLEEKMNETLAAKSRSIVGNFSLFMLLLCGASLAVGTMVAWFISSSLLKQLGGEPAYAASVASRIAAGDLATTIDIKPDDRLSLMFAMHGMRDSLAQIVGQVRQGFFGY